MRSCKKKPFVVEEVSCMLEARNRRLSSCSCEIESHKFLVSLRQDSSICSNSYNVTTSSQQVVDMLSVLQQNDNNMIIE